LAKVSGWTSHDKAFNVKVKLQGLALQFLNGREELGRDQCPYEVLSQALIERFSDKLPNILDYRKQFRGRTNARRSSVTAVGKCV
jgi:hypothetical protein